MKARAQAAPVVLASEEVVQGIANWAARVDAAFEVRRAAAGILTLLAKSVQATRGSVLLLEPSTGRMIVASGLGLPGIQSGTALPLGRRRISSVVMRSGQSMLLHGEARDRRFDASAKDDRLVSSMCVPLRGARGVIGMLSLSRIAPAERFNPGELASVESLGKAVGAIFERMADLSCARAVWRELTARPREGARPVIAAGELEVSRFPGMTPAPGLCEWHANPDGSLSLMAGRAVGSALDAYETRARLCGMFHARAGMSMSASELAAWMDETLRTGWPGATARVWIGVCSKYGQLSSCAAGAEPPFWMHAEGEQWQRLVEGGPALGTALAPEDYEETSLRLLPGDALIAVGENVLGAWSSEAGAFTEAHLMEQVFEHRRDALEAQVSAWTSAMLEHTGLPRPTEDLFALVLRHHRQE